MTFLPLMAQAKRWAEDFSEISTIECEIAYKEACDAVPLDSKTRSAAEFLGLLNDGLRVIGYTLALKYLNPELLQKSTSSASMIMLALTVACREWQNGKDRFTGKCPDLAVKVFPSWSKLVEFSVQALSVAPNLVKDAESEITGIGLFLAAENGCNIPEIVPNFNASTRLREAKVDMVKEDLCTIAFLYNVGFSMGIINGYVMARYYLKWSRARRSSENLATV